MSVIFVLTFAAPRLAHVKHYRPKRVLGVKKRAINWAAKGKIGAELTVAAVVEKTARHIIAIKQTKPDSRPGQDGTGGTRKTTPDRQKMLVQRLCQAESPNGGRGGNERRSQERSPQDAQTRMERKN